MFVRPAPGLLVRDPKTRRKLSASGKEVPENTFWLRRLQAGDVLLCAAPAPVAVSNEPVLSVDQIPDSNAVDEVDQ